MIANHFKEEEECPVCLSSRESMVSLQQCGHKICIHCERSLRKIDTTNRNKYKIKCPLCRNETIINRTSSVLSVDSLEKEARKYVTSFEALSIPFIPLMKIIQERMRTKMCIRFATEYEVVHCAETIFSREAHKETESFVSVELMDRFVRMEDQRLVSYYEATYIPDGLLFALIKERKAKKCVAYLCTVYSTQSINGTCKGYICHTTTNNRSITRRFCPNHPSIICCHHCFFCTTCYSPFTNAPATLVQS
jgi:hypothetical protein